MAAKQEFSSLALSTDHDLIIVDPEREYGPLVRALGGEVITISASRLKRYAEERGMQITAYYEDNGYSGNDLSRPGLAKLMADHKKGMFDVVLVVNRSRLYRGNSQNEPQWPFQIDSLNPLEHDTVR